MENNIKLEEHILNYQKKGPKYKQVIWLSSDTFFEIVKLSDQFKLAPNIIISAIITAFVKNMPLFVREKEKIVEKIVPQEYVYLCAVCGEEIKPSELQIHLLRCKMKLRQELQASK